MPKSKSLATVIRLHGGPTPEEFATIAHALTIMIQDRCTDTPCAQCAAEAEQIEAARNNARKWVEILERAEP